jgi:hypothetical protein
MIHDYQVHRVGAFRERATRVCGRVCVRGVRAYPLDSACGGARGWPLVVLVAHMPHMGSSGWTAGGGGGRSSESELRI